ncbi:MAG TPA: transketolase [Oligoflexia bacterium]|nr:transketolase [Oligoflexia bacterium]HMR24784.1 transketolase [Oligoflexia bacterium]
MDKAIDIDQLCVNTIKCLSIDAVEKAQSGHPGMPMGMADSAYVLWNNFLNFDSSQPNWEGRDRFILSAGHGSMLQYALLHLYGYKLSIDDIKEFRQLGSLTPGHPEYKHTDGVEVTTGPLGQGFANGVGMALAAKMQASQFKQSHLESTIYGIVSDGDLMEGISSEAASLAGHLGLGNLNYIYDSNSISIDGSTDITFNENIRMRFEAQGWHVQEIDGHNHSEITLALERAKKESHKPSLIIAKTIIAHGAPTKQGTSGSHGAPLGKEEITAFKQLINWDYPEFTVPDAVYKHCQDAVKQKQNAKNKWLEQHAAFKASDPMGYENYQNFNQKKFKAIHDEIKKDTDATRSINGQILQYLGKTVPNLCAGSADLAGSTKAIFKDSDYVNKEDFSARNIAFGIREHAMAAIANGMVLYGGHIPVISTFLVFSDYLKPSLRLSALSGLQVIYALTHDSLHVGEDGPTHQPIEHINAMRCIPNVNVYRPANIEESQWAWDKALADKNTPSVFCLSRQNLPMQASLADSISDHGAYIFAQHNNQALAEDKQLIIASSGSELHLAHEVFEAIKQDYKTIKLISVPCLDRLQALEKSEQEKLFVQNCPTVVIEAANADAWHKTIGRPNLVIDMQSFGASGPGEAVAKHFGFDKQTIIQKIKAWKN